MIRYHAPRYGQWNGTFFEFSFITEGATEKALKFFMSVS
jgi:hypothetical protein